MSSSRELVRKAITFQGVERLVYDFPENYGSDFYYVYMKKNVDERPKEGRDEWGALWSNIGNSRFGEVKEYPLENWSDFDDLTIPDIDSPDRWKGLENIRALAGEKFVLCIGISIYERVHFLRGLENTWIDIYENKEELEKLLDILVEMNIKAIGHFSRLGGDGYFFPDDWGLQDRLMISPELWREIWKPRYAKIYKAAHDAGMLTFLHSCGNITDILDDLIEVGLDVIHMDQQENMGLEMLGQRFGGRITFFSPVDIQNTMINGTTEEIKLYCQKMVACLMKPNGGFIPRWYTDPIGAGHSNEALDTMCKEFLKISKNISDDCK